MNARIDAMIEKYRPEEDKKKYGYTAFVKPIRDTYRNYESVERMRNIMTVLGLAILFIAALNYVLISISSLTYRAKAVGVHKCNGASGGKIFGMFLLETGIIIAAALLLMALVLLNFREFFEDTAAAKLSLLLAPERIWVPLTVVGILFWWAEYCRDVCLPVFPYPKCSAAIPKGRKAGSVRCFSSSLQAWHSFADLCAW